MRRADRLFQIIQLLRRRRSVTTAAELARRLEVSERTIYRDIRDLAASGTPIDGEAGVGYRLGAGYDLPPLMFDREEIQALALGARIVQTLGDAGLGKAAASVLSKAAAAMPEDLEALLRRTPLYAPPTRWGRAPSDTLARTREALLGRRKLRLKYLDKSARPTTRTVRPLAAFFWGHSWTLAAWCELRTDFRNFRMDRIARLDLLDEPFADEPGKSLADMLARYGPEAMRLLSG